MQNASTSAALWAVITEPMLRLERQFGIRPLRRVILAMLAAWFGYFVVISMWARALNKVTVPFLDVPLGIFLAGQGTAVIFCAALALMVKIASATGAMR